MQEPLRPSVVLAYELHSAFAKARCQQKACVRHFRTVEWRHAKGPFGSTGRGLKLTGGWKAGCLRCLVLRGEENLQRHLLNLILQVFELVNVMIFVLEDGLQYVTRGVIEHVAG